MENLTHSLVGALLARSGLGGDAPRSTALCVVAANIADIDIVAGTSAASYLVWHRHFTHSFAFVPVMAALALLIVEGLARLGGGRSRPPVRWGPAYLTALAAAATHPLLDLTNTYGTRVWLPFSHGWADWDIFFIVEPWSWVILVAAWLAPVLARWAGWPKSGDWRRRAAICGLIGLLFFAWSKAVFHARAVALASVQSYDREFPLAVAVFPSFFPWNPLRWTGYAETREAFHLGEIGLGRPLKVEDWARFEKSETNEAIEAAWQSGLGKAYSQFTQFPYVEVSRRGSHWLVTLSDFRFRQGDRAGFLCVIELNERFEVVRDSFEF